MRLIAKYIVLVSVNFDMAVTCLHFYSSIIVQQVQINRDTLRRKSEEMKAKIYLREKKTATRDSVTETNLPKLRCHCNFFICEPRYALELLVKIRSHIGVRVIGVQSQILFLGFISTWKIGNLNFFTILKILFTLSKYVVQGRISKI